VQEAAGPGLFNNLLSISAFHYDRESVDNTDNPTAVGEKHNQQARRKACWLTAATGDTGAALRS